MRFKEIQEGTRCWKGYERKGMKTMFGKRVPNCVKREDVETSEKRKKRKEKNFYHKEDERCGKQDVT